MLRRIYHLLLVLSCILATSGPVSAQGEGCTDSTTSVKYLSGQPINFNDFIVASDGGKIFAGYSNDPANRYPLHQLVVIRTGPDNQITWQKEISISKTAVFGRLPIPILKESSDKGIVLACIFSGIAAGAGLNDSLMVLRLSAAGQLEWCRYFRINGSTLYTTFITGVCETDNQDNIFIGLSTTKITGGMLPVVMKMDKAGNMIWSKAWFPADGIFIYLGGLFLNAGRLQLLARTNGSNVSHLNFTINPADGALVNATAFTAILPVSPFTYYLAGQNITKAWRLPDGRYVTAGECSKLTVVGQPLPPDKFHVCFFDKNLSLIKSLLLQIDDRAVGVARNIFVTPVDSGRVMATVATSNDVVQVIIGADYQLGEQKKFIFPDAGPSGRYQFEGGQQIIGAAQLFNGSSYAGLQAWEFSYHKSLPASCVLFKDTSALTLEPFSLTPAAYVFSPVMDNVVIEFPISATVSNFDAVQQTGCFQKNSCTGIKINGPANVCVDDTGETRFMARLNNGCQTGINWKMDASFLSSFNKVDDSTIAVRFRREGRWVLQAATDNACRLEDSIVVTLQCKPGGTALLFPNAFTPGKNANTLFRPMVKGALRRYELAIFNRFGQKIIQSVDPRQGWNGEVNGRMQQTGAFIWVCKYQFAGEQEKIIRGSLLLLR